MTDAPTLDPVAIAAAWVDAGRAFESAIVCCTSRQAVREAAEAAIRSYLAATAKAATVDDETALGAFNVYCGTLGGVVPSMRAALEWFLRTRQPPAPERFEAGAYICSHPRDAEYQHVPLWFGTESEREYFRKLGWTIGARIEPSFPEWNGT